jgi:hypothetical protein
MHVGILMFYFNIMPDLTIAIYFLYLIVVICSLYALFKIIRFFVVVRKKFKKRPTKEEWLSIPIKKREESMSIITWALSFIATFLVLFDVV